MKKLNFTKKILLILVLIVSAVFINSYALIANLSTRAVTQFAQNNYDSTSRTLEIKNGKFTTHTSQGKGTPDKVDNWEVADDVMPNAIQGIINVDKKTFDETKYNSLTNPDKPTGIEDNFVLAMAANTGVTTRYGYKSANITLENDKFYAVRVFCKTMNGAKASIYTTLSNPDSTTEENNFVGFSTNGEWQAYHFLIATDSFNSSENFNIELRIGTRGTNEGSTSSGSVFFDNVEIVEIASRDFEYADTDSYNIRKINLDNDYVEGLENANFENNLQGFDVTNYNGDSKTIVEVLTSGAIENDNRLKQFNISLGSTDNNVGLKEENKKLLIANLQDAVSVVKTSESNKITIKQHEFYRLSMLIKTSSFSSGGLDVTLTNTTNLLNNSEEIISKAQTGLKSGSQSAYNDYTRVDFYIRGNVFEDCELSLTMALGTEESKITGWAIIDNITLQRISSQEYAKGSDSNQLDLSKNVPNTSDFTNGLFNFITSNNSKVSYPATPQDWTASANLTGSGIVRVNETLFTEDAFLYNYGITVTPGANKSGGEPIQQGADTYENVLMVKNSSQQNNQDVYFTSNPSNNVTLSENISSSTIVKISVAVKTVNNSRAFIRIVNSNNEVIGGIDDISTLEAEGTITNGWVTYSIYIKNGINSKAINIQLGTHGSKGATTYAFFDDVTYSSNEESFNLTNFLKQETEQDKQTYKNSIYIDLLENGFYSHSQLKNGNYFKQNSMVSHKADEGVVQYNGILDGSKITGFNVHKDAVDKNVLALTNSSKSCQVLKSVDTYELTKDSYYEFSVWVKTIGLSGLSDKYGAHFEIVNTDDDGNVIENEENKNKFSNIVVSDTEDNGWVKYSIFVVAESAEKVKVLLGLGYGENATEGTVYFDDLKVASITENEYINASSNNNATTLVSKVIEAPKEEDNNTNSDDSSNGNSVLGDINIWALLSSILLVIALVLAIIGYAIRRIPKRQVIKKIKANEYGKSPYAVDENEIKRELNLAREQKVTELNAELDKLTSEKTELEAKFEEELKQNENSPEKNKLYVKYTKEINKLNKRITYLQSALTYITDLANIKNEEIRTINERKKQSKEEFIKLKQEELEKEELEKLKETEEVSKPKKKKYKKVSSKNNGK